MGNFPYAKSGPPGTAWIYGLKIGLFNFDSLRNTFNSLYSFKTFDESLYFFDETPFQYDEALLLAFFTPIFYKSSG